MFSVVCDKDIKPESIKPGEKIYLDTSHFLPFARFLPKKVEKGANKGANQNQKGKVETLIEEEKEEEVVEEDHKEEEVDIDLREVEALEDIDLPESKENKLF